MGQNSTMILTKEFSGPIPEEIVHFFQKDYLVLPLDFQSATHLVDYFVEFDSLEEIRAQRKIEYREVFELIWRLNLQTFILFHWSEHGDMPIDFFQLIIQNGLILKHTKIPVDENDDYYSETILGYLVDGDEFDTTPYWNYPTCEYRYLKELTEKRTGSAS